MAKWKRFVSVLILLVAFVGGVRSVGRGFRNWPWPTKHGVPVYSKISCHEARLRAAKGVLVELGKGTGAVAYRSGPEESARHVEKKLVAAKYAFVPMVIIHAEAGGEDCQWLLYDSAATPSPMWRQMEWCDAYALVAGPVKDVWIFRRKDRE